MEFFVGDPAFESLLALFAAPAEDRLAPIGHPARDAGTHKGKPSLARETHNRRVEPDLARNPGTRRGEACLARESGTRRGKPGLARNPGTRRGEACLARESLREAAVLIAVSRPAGDASPSKIVLTVRSENLKSHAGQISLPGGSIEPEDADLAAAALREAEEEIGLPPKKVEVIGELGPMALPSGFLVTPVVGLIQPGLKFTACSREVADIFETPLDLILNPEAYVRSSYLHAGVKRRTLELHYEDYRIWGATAAILHRLAVLAAG